jgi:hypothetical protein
MAQHNNYLIGLFNALPTSIQHLSFTPAFAGMTQEDNRILAEENNRRLATEAAFQMQQRIRYYEHNPTAALSTALGSGSIPVDSDSDSDGMTYEDHFYYQHDPYSDSDSDAAGGDSAPPADAADTVVSVVSVDSAVDRPPTYEAAMDLVVTEYIRNIIHSSVSSHPPEYTAQ